MKLLICPLFYLSSPAFIALIVNFCKKFRPFAERMGFPYNHFYSNMSLARGFVKDPFYSNMSLARGFVKDPFYSNMSLARGFVKDPFYSVDLAARGFVKDPFYSKMSLIGLGYLPMTPMTVFATRHCSRL